VVPRRKKGPGKVHASKNLQSDCQEKRKASLPVSAPLHLPLFSDTTCLAGTETGAAAGWKEEGAAFRLKGLYRIEGVPLC